MKKLNQKGFSHFEIILIILVVAALGFAGYLVFKKDKPESTTKTTETTKSQAAQKTEAEKPQPKSKTLSLANNAVSFETPLNWEKEKVGCVKESAAYGSEEYIDSTGILPGEKLRTVYGDGTEYFHVNACVFKNKDNKTAKAWYENIWGEGSNVDESVTTINSYQTYYRKQKGSAQNSNIEEVNYVVSAKNLIILVEARTYETNSKLPGVGDFRKFEAPIKDFVNTIKIN